MNWKVPGAFHRININCFGDSCTLYNCDQDNDDIQPINRTRKLQRRQHFVQWRVPPQRIAIECPTAWKWGRAVAQLSPFRNWQYFHLHIYWTIKVNNPLIAYDSFESTTRPTNFCGMYRDSAMNPKQLGRDIGGRAVEVNPPWFRYDHFSLVQIEAMGNNTCAAGLDCIYVNGLRVGWAGQEEIHNANF